MAPLRNYNLHKNGLFPKSLEIMYAHDKRWNLKFKRLLARNVQKRELEHTRLREKLPDRRAFKSENVVSDELSIYPRVKGKASNNIDTYMKNYKNRYMKKKGLSKLDCYYENKLFGKLCHISDIGKRMNYDKKRSKRFFLKKYGIGLLLFALLPVIGLIFPILFGPGGKNPGILGLCEKSDHKNSSDNMHIIDNSGNDCEDYWFYEYRDSINSLGYVNMVCSFIIVAIVLLVFIYIFSKVIKYERLKCGKGKMNIKEYSRFCKDIFL